eukprot:CAMPEP_0179377994 /NCGR_PEP_ID=MMETSP0797-20121207/89108_1 /TAXON_ID=47934 /ORGANISM="Dinophysis acuminata, Strain DAEP01" /LENGTH=711 /DNA_ID=CAMNT_0021094055 /DNA_START=96 /DNA_END=2228 /DNA_ORIENTATION=+
MKCPYCAAFPGNAGRKAKRIQNVFSDQVTWQYEEEEDKWVSFSTPGVSQLLETAYQNWMHDPQLRPLPQVRSGNFLYNVDVASMSQMHDSHKSQRIRRVGVTDGDSTDAMRYCAVEPSLWKEHKSKHAALKAEAERLRQERSKVRGELRELRERNAEQRRELEELRLEREAAGRLRAQFSGVCPGRLVRFVPGPGGPDGSCGLPPPGTLGRVIAVEGNAAAVDFPGKKGVWLPSRCVELAQEAELLARPGTRAEWYDDATGSRQRGVVCGFPDAAAVRLLGPDGGTHVCQLEDLRLEHGTRPAHAPPEAGDLVQVADEAGRARLQQHAVSSCSTGVVVSRDCSNICIRFRDEASRAADDDGHVDISFEASELRVQRDERANKVRPGAAVCFRDPLNPLVAQGQSRVGIVHANCGDGMSIVDFLGNIGCRCDAALLDVLDHPRTLDHDVLRALSEFLSWQEHSVQRREEQEEDRIVRSMSRLPSMLAPRGSPSGCTRAELAPQSGLFRFLAAALLGAFACPGHSGGGRGRGGLPALSVERIEELRNPDLQRSYELGLREFVDAHPAGCARLADEEALRVLGPPVDCNEVFLWHSAPPDEIERICSDGFTPVATGAGTGQAGAGGAARGGGGHAPTDVRCSLLVRVLLGESAVAEGTAATRAAHPRGPGETDAYDSVRTVHFSADGVLDYSEHVVRRPSQALPLFRVFYRHEE